MSKRSGLAALKTGMSEMYNGFTSIPVTLLRILDDNEIISIKTEDKEGYDAAVMSFSLNKAKNVSKPVQGIYNKLKLKIRSHIKEFRVSKDIIESYKDKDGKLSSGINYGADHFKTGEYLDATAINKGKGFAGVIKRHGFAGLEASHGVSVSHRSAGSTGHRTEPGRVFKNKKMAGHMGARKTTVQSLKIVDVIPSENLVVVLGSVPGPNRGLVFLQDAVKKS